MLGMVVSVLLALKSMRQENHKFKNRLGLKKKIPNSSLIDVMRLLTSVAKHLARSNLKEEELIWAPVWRSVAHGGRKKWQQERVAAGRTALDDAFRKQIPTGSGVGLYNQPSTLQWLFLEERLHPSKVSPSLETVPPAVNQGSNRSLHRTFQSEQSSPVDWNVPWENIVNYTFHLIAVGLFGLSVPSSVVFVAFENFTWSGKVA